MANPVWESYVETPFAATASPTANMPSPINKGDLLLAWFVSSTGANLSASTGWQTLSNGSEQDSGSSFCAELGLDGERAMAAFQLDPMGPLGVLLGEDARELLKLESDAVEVARRADELRDFWRHAIRRADSANRPGAS